MRYLTEQEKKGRMIGTRAENVANWYFRLNGFLSIPGFVVHPDYCREFPRTEADLIAVRFPFSTESIAERKMVDDTLVTRLYGNDGKQRMLFILVEVKSGTCKMNGPWSNPRKENMHRVIRRLGFAEECEIDSIATAMYHKARWDNDDYVLQYVCVGRVIDALLTVSHSELVQITFEQMSAFFADRFKSYPEKLPTGGQVHEQWPDFGREFGSWFYKNISIPRVTSLPTITAMSGAVVRMYIETGRLSNP